ncbi:MAG: 50S ribosomal protein L31e [Candidatus Nanoarchaeia archaeon]
MAKLERNYTIPLRKNFVKVPKYYRSKRAINHIKAFIVRHMKVAEEDIKLGKNLNEKVWMHGIKNPPGKVKVKVIKDNDKVTVELEGFEYKVEKVQLEKVDKPTTLKDKLAEKMGVKDDAEEETKDEAESKKATPEKKPVVKKTPVKKSAQPAEPKEE